MQKLLLIVLVVLVASCNDQVKGKNFTVSGTIHNSTAKMVYLEKVPAATMQPSLEDSAVIGKDGKFSLGSDATESVVFNLRLDQSNYPIASVINDTDKVKLDIQLQKGDNQFAEKYDVEGSPASIQMRDFMLKVNNDLMSIYTLAQKADSLQGKGGADSVIFPLLAQQKQIGENIRTYALDALAKANDPALAIFELGYYQSTANSTRYGLPPIANEQVGQIVDNTAKKFPAHQAVAAIKATLDQQRQKAMLSNWVGKEAPDFSMPDPNGKVVALSSFRGKYVLIDFWASWCTPCRQENPNLVNAYKQFKGKNFTILGVSLDMPGQKDKWLKAIMDDKLTWTNISDLQYWSSPIVPLYGFDGIPFNVLVDPSGKVIAQELRGPALENRLTELLN